MADVTNIANTARWYAYCMKAGIVAYMQLYLPVKIAMDEVSQWNYLGIKSPFYFVANATTFVTKIAALGSLCAMFSGKCTESIRTGAEANFYILSHSKPAEDTEMGTVRSAARYFSKLYSEGTIIF